MSESHSKRGGITIHVGDCRESMAAMSEQSVQCVVTSPPYWGLRDYGVDRQLGLEPTPDEYLAGMVDVFRAVRRVLRDDGTCWVNMGDGYANTGCGGSSVFDAGRTDGRDGDGGKARLVESRKATTRATIPLGLKPKDLIGMPWRLAFALQADGWYLRSDIIWAKPNPMPESVTDRPTKSHEYMFLLTKRGRYFYDADAVREKGTWPAGTRAGKSSVDVQDLRLELERSGKGRCRPAALDGGQGHIYSGLRNLRDVWTIPTEAYAEAHFATFPRRLVEPCIKAGTSDKGCCPECGAPWRRVVEKDRRATRPGLANVNDLTGMANRDSGRHVTESTTVGWECGCTCGCMSSVPPRTNAFTLSPVPCVVLDPFAGSGTTGVVAKQLGRSFVGCELNPAYAEMARKRIENPEPLPKVEDVAGQLTMFG